MKNVRTIRIIAWILTIIVGVGLILGKDFIVERKSVEKKQITVYAPSDMEKAFKKAISKSGLKTYEYDFKLTTEKPKDADLVVEYAKKDDRSYFKFAYSPFVLAYGTSNTSFEKLKKANTVFPYEYNEECYVIDLEQVVQEVIEEGKWENLGLNDKGEIKIFYPSENTIYWQDFYDFMIINLNYGTYPKDEKEMKKAIEYFERFENSNKTEAIDDLAKQIKITDGYTDKAFYIFPEKAISDSYYSVRLIYPVYSVYFNYYLKSNSEIGNSIQKSLDESNFYSELSDSNYRNDIDFDIPFRNYRWQTILGTRNTFNVVKIPNNSDTK